METDLRYPIGKFETKGPFTNAQRNAMIASMAAMPENLRAAVKGLDEKQLDTPYRGSGWTLRQVVHHVADSHMNSYIRFRLGITEAEPTIKTYDEKTWAELFDARTAPVETSLLLIESLHKRWVMLLETVREIDFNRNLRHPERGTMSLDDTLALYEWHGRHHTAQIAGLRQRNGW